MRKRHELVYLDESQVNALAECLSDRPHARPRALGQALDLHEKLYYPLMLKEKWKAEKNWHAPFDLYNNELFFDVKLSTQGTFTVSGEEYIFGESNNYHILLYLLKGPYVCRYEGVIDFNELKLFLIKSLEHPEPGKLRGWFAKVNDVLHLCKYDVEVSNGNSTR